MQPQPQRGAPTPRPSSPGAQAIRPYRPGDAPELLALLEWMDERPEREVLAPTARRADDLATEFRGRRAFVEVSADGDVVGFAALCDHADGQAIEGPLAADADPGPVLAAAVAAARPEATLLAFASRDNGPVRPALLAAGLEPFLETGFFGLARSRWRSGRARLPDGTELIAVADVDLSAYRSLYRECEEAWVERLAWTEARWRRRVGDPDVRLVLVGCGGRPVAHCEVEIEESVARVAYLGVLPAFRGRGLGRAALSMALDLAFERPEVARATVRAHDHEREAVGLYASAGFRPERSVVAHARWAAEI